MAIAPTLNVPQARFLAMQQKFKAYVAGFGSGKTWVGCGGICKGFWEFPKINQGYFAPTYPQIRDIFYPTVEEVAHDWGLKVKIVLKADQRSGKLTEGVVKDILTNSPTHPHGIKVRLESGEVGRVKEIL